MPEPMTTPRTDVHTHTLETPGAVLTYDVRRPDTAAGPPLLMIGSPMDAGGFADLATHFTDRTVVTYDPRGVERSTRTDPSAEVTPHDHADDLHRIIAALGGGPVDVFASSGGAVNALVLVATHPDDGRTLVAHEPPAVDVLPDREQALAAVADIGRTYQARGFGPAMAKFIALTSHQGPIPDLADLPEPDPAQFGLPADDDGSRGDPLLEQNLISCTHHRHDLDALRRAPTRVVIGVGAESAGALTDRTSAALAEQLGTTAVTFPSHHAGFVADDHGMQGEPEAFAATLRQVLDGDT
ncbi:MAG: alpha/beta hydrolase [Actinomycetota bacterium]|nr:alpha/beta hydrolase [Actinomycetota bacterium]